MFNDESIEQGVREFDTPEGRMRAESPFNDGTWKVFFRDGGVLLFECTVMSRSGSTADIYHKWKDAPVKEERE